MSARARDAVEADAAAIVALNLESEAVLSPMGAARFERLRAHAAYLRVIEDAGAVVAFLMAFRERADYDSVNYRWFDAHYDAFLYVDRVVVSSACQGRGFGALLYADLFAFARDAGVPRVTCEFDVEPPNEASRRFHARHGFVEVGTQALPGGKRVSLQCATA
ncbi:GNAT family acetyltransferase [Lysobacter helvus]|uniref:GNAT family acetyltransferase n=2 Tax=Lysobacteraceae TaxID=32033 RepID=A0ABM7Q4E7_9GAMM|nr:MULTISPECIES: GNAT family N-acetyltransferase [Lysobacter]BCT92172.1 GNAT family acetyltransferase [Lysobacter caseinilyticus]BCT95325.1 GNAT family acetyltransferase [Lysobacter helvus]